MDKLFTGAEVDKLLILRQVKDKALTGIEGANRLQISTRQLRRMLRRYEREGARGVKRGASGGNRAHKAEYKAKVLGKVKEKYWDFGPTFAAEKLWELDQLKINKETLGQWMMEAGIWRGKKRKVSSLHQSRDRRESFGELVQIDGSHHAWFEGRRAKSCLLVFVDDASSRIVAMRMEESETTMGYLRAIENHISGSGRPLAYYSDRHSIFRTTRKQDGAIIYQDTQVHRALKDLGIELICAYSPQAKGRVERSNQTLQDGFIKEMRLRNISTIEEANAYIPEFIESYNQKFAVPPISGEDAHRAVHSSKEELERILATHHTRKLSKTLEFSFQGKMYQVQRPGAGYRYQGARVRVCKNTKGGLSVLHGKEVLKVKLLLTRQQVPLLADRKDIDRVFDQHILPSVKDPSSPQGPQPQDQLAMDGC